MYPFIAFCRYGKIPETINLKRENVYCVAHVELFEPVLEKLTMVGGQDGEGCLPSDGRKQRENRKG